MLPSVSFCVWDNSEKKHSYTSKAFSDAEICLFATLLLMLF